MRPAPGNESRGRSARAFRLEGEPHGELQVASAPVRLGVVNAAGHDGLLAAVPIGVFVPLNVERIESIHIHPYIRLLRNWKYFEHGKIGFVVERSMDDGMAVEVVAGKTLTGIGRESNGPRFSAVQIRTRHHNVVSAEIGLLGGIIVDRHLVGHVRGWKTRHAIGCAVAPVSRREKLGRDVSVEPQVPREALATGAVRNLRLAVLLGIQFAGRYPIA